MNDLISREQSSAKERIQMSATDLISRQDAIDALRAAYWDENIQSAKDDPCIVDAMTDWAIRQIKALPSAERKGKWNHPYHYGLALPEHQCSECGYWEYADSESNYCPYCGAKMEGEEE